MIVSRWVCHPTHIFRRLHRKGKFSIWFPLFTRQYSGDKRLFLGFGLSLALDDDRPVLDDSFLVLSFRESLSLFQGRHFR